MMHTAPLRHATLLIVAAMFSLVWALRVLAGDEAPLAWWERETALKPGGILDLKEKSWWPRAKALKPGEHFAVHSELPGGGRMLVRCETLTRRGGKPQNAVVWIINDNGDMPPDATDGDRRTTATWWITMATVWPTAWSITLTTATASQPKWKSAISSMASCESPGSASIWTGAGRRGPWQATSTREESCSAIILAATP